jgi:hypothetical protein
MLAKNLKFHKDRPLFRGRQAEKKQIEIFYGNAASNRWADSEAAAAMRHHWRWLNFAYVSLKKDNNLNKKDKIATEGDVVP